MFPPPSSTTEETEIPDRHDDKHSSTSNLVQAVLSTSPLPPVLPTDAAATRSMGSLPAPPAVAAPKLGLESGIASRRGDKTALNQASQQPVTLTLPAGPHATGARHASAEHDDRPIKQKDLTPSSKSSQGSRRSQNQHGGQPKARAAPDNVQQIRVLPGDNSSASGVASMSQPTSAIPRPRPPLLATRPSHVTSGPAPIEPRLMLTRDRGLVPVQLIPQVRQAVRPVAAPPVVQQGRPAVGLPLQLRAAVPLPGKKEEVLSPEEGRPALHSDRVQVMQSRPEDESTSSGSEDDSSSTPVHPRLNVRRPTVETRRSSVETVNAPVVGTRRLSGEAIRAPVQDRRTSGGSTHAPVQDRRTSGESAYAPLQARRTSGESIPAPVQAGPMSGESIHAPVQAKRMSADSTHAPGDEKRPSVHTKRPSADSGHPSISAGAPQHAAASKAPERSVAAPPEKAEVTGKGQGLKKSLAEEGPPPPPPPSVDATSLPKIAALAKADMKRGSTAASLATSPTSPAPPPKSSWWYTLSSPFANADPGPSAAGHEEGAAASHPRRHSMAVADTQRALGRTNLRVKRAPAMAEELKEYAAALDAAWTRVALVTTVANSLVNRRLDILHLERKLAALHFSHRRRAIVWAGVLLVPGTGDRWTGAPPAAIGRPAPQPVIEDYLDYDIDQRLQHSLDTEISNGSSSRRRRKRATCVGLLVRCLLLFFMVMVPCTLLFVTFRLGQILYKSTPQQIGSLVTTEEATKTTPADTAVPTKPRSTEYSTSAPAATTASNTATALPSSEELYDDDSDRDPTCTDPEYIPGPPMTDVVDTTNYSYTSPTTIQFRKLLCVLNTQYFSNRRPYSIERLPIGYCSELIFYALHFNTSVQMKRAKLDEAILRAVDELREKRLHRGKKMRLHFTLGGSRQDSPWLVRLLERYEERDAIINQLSAHSAHFDGLNIHWDRPGDNCDKQFTATMFRALIEELRRRRFNLMLTVPPVVELVRRFWLINIMRYLEYVIVLTHTLRRKGLLDCPGRRQFAAASYHAIREHVLKETSNPRHAAKIVYSISLGADVFKATLTLSYPQLMDAATPSSVFNGPTVQTDKTSYDNVCRLKKHTFQNDDECVWALGTSSTSGTEIALYAGPEELTLRMRRSYADRFGDAPVALFDLFLDDFDGNCKRPGQSLSPQVAAIAEASLPL